MTIPTDILLLFCDRDLAHENLPLSKPWRHGGQIWACDGRCLLAIPDDGRELVTHEQPAIKYPAKLLVPCAGEWRPLPGPLAETEDCGWCYGHGWMRVKCVACDGSGEHYCDQCEAPHPCGKCHGDGEVNCSKPCPLCRRTKKSPVDQSIYGVWFCGWMLQRLRLLGEVRYWLPDQNGLRFTGDGFDGLLMSITKDESES